MFFFSHPPLRAGCCLFLETLFSAILGVPGAGVTPGPLPPPHLPPQTSCRWPGPSASVPGRLAFPGRVLLAGRAWARSWRGGPAPARKLKSLCSRPAPPGEGRRERSGGRAGEAWAGPARALVPARASSGSPSRARSAGSPRRAQLALPRSPRASAPPWPPPLPLLGWLHTLGLGEEQQRALELGRCSALHASSRCGRASVCPSLKWGKESRFAECLWI